jgi:hypothetical protein
MARGRWAKVVVGALALGLVVLAVARIAVASATSGAGAGKITCSISSGVISLNPQPLPPSGGTQMDKVTIKAKAIPPTPCSGAVMLGGKSVTTTGVSMVLVGFVQGDPKDPYVLGSNWNGTINWKSKPKIANSTVTYRGGHWQPPGPTNLPATGGSLVSVSGSFGGSSNPTESFSLAFDATLPPTLPTKATTIAISGGTLSAVGGTSTTTTTVPSTTSTSCPVGTPKCGTTTTIPPTTTTTCSPFGCGYVSRQP